MIRLQPEVTSRLSQPLPFKYQDPVRIAPVSVATRRLYSDEELSIEGEELLGDLRRIVTAFDPVPARARSAARVAFVVHTRAWSRDALVVPAHARPKRGGRDHLMNPIQAQLATPPDGARPPQPSARPPPNQPDPPAGRRNLNLADRGSKLVLRPCPRDTVAAAAVDQEAGSKSEILDGCQRVG